MRLLEILLISIAKVYRFLFNLNIIDQGLVQQGTFCDFPVLNKREVDKFNSYSDSNESSELDDVNMQSDDEIDICE